MAGLIESVDSGVPTALIEVTKLGRTLKKRAADVLAASTDAGTSNGPPEAINGRLEHLRGNAPGFRNLTNYIARSLLESGGSGPNYTLDSDEPQNWGLPAPFVYAIALLGYSSFLFAWSAYAERVASFGG